MTDSFDQIEDTLPEPDDESTIRPWYITERPPGQGKLFALLLPNYIPESDLKSRTIGLDDADTANIDETFNNPREVWPEERRRWLVNMGSHRVAIAGQPIKFDSSLSYDGQGRMARKTDWDFGDGTRGEGRYTEHTYLEPGQYVVTCEVETGHARRFVRVLDQFGESDMDIVSIDSWEASLDVGWTIKLTVTSTMDLQRLQGILLYTDDTLDTSWRGRWDKQFLRLGKRYSYTGRAPSRPDWQTITVNTTSPTGLGGGELRGIIAPAPYDATEEGMMPVGTIRQDPEWDKINEFDRMFYYIGNDYGIHPNLLKAICKVRSNGNANKIVQHPNDPDALVEGYTTYGLGQLTCRVDTGQYAFCNRGANLLDPEKNLERLCQILMQHYQDCGGWERALYKFHSNTCEPSDGYDSADRSTNKQFYADVLYYWDLLKAAVEAEEIEDLFPNANDVVFSGYILDAVESIHPGDGIRRRWDLTVVDVSQALDLVNQREEKFFEEEPEVGGGTIMGRPMRSSHILHHTLQEHINYDRRHDIIIDYSGPRQGSTVTSEGGVLSAFRAIANNEFANIWGDSQGRLHFRQRASYRGMGGWFKDARKLAIYVDPLNILDVKVDDRLQGDFTSWVQLKGNMSLGICSLVAEYPCTGPPAQSAGLWDLVSGLQIDDWKTLCRLAAQHYAHLNRNYDVELLMYWRHDLDLGDLIYMPIRDPSGGFDWATSETYENDPFFVITEMGHQYDVTNATWLTRIKAQQVTYLRRCECPRPICVETIFDTQEPGEDEMPTPRPPSRPPSDPQAPPVDLPPDELPEPPPPQDIDPPDYCAYEGAGAPDDQGICAPPPPPCNSWATGGKIDELIAYSEQLNGTPSPIAGLGWLIVQLGLTYGINPGVVAAIMQQATQMGTDGSPLSLNNNFGGVTGVGTCGSVEIGGTYYASYCTPQDGIYGLYETLHSALYRESGGTLADIIAIKDPDWGDNPAEMWEIFANIGLQLGVSLLPDTYIYGSANCEGEDLVYEGCEALDLSDGGYGFTDPDTGEQVGWIRDTTPGGAGWEYSKDDDQKNVASAVTGASSGYINPNQEQTPENDYNVTGNARARVSGQFRFPPGVARHNAFFRVELEPWEASGRRGPSVTIYAEDHTEYLAKGIGAVLHTETSVDAEKTTYPTHPICPWERGQENNGTLNFQGRPATLNDWHVFEIFFDEAETPQRTYLTMDGYSEYVEDVWYQTGTCNATPGHPGELCGGVHTAGHRIKMSFGADEGYQGDPAESTMGHVGNFGSLQEPFGIARGLGNTAYVVDSATGNIYMFNTLTNQLIRTVYQGTASDNLFGLAYLGGKLFVSANTGRAIRRIDPDSGLVEHTWTTSTVTFDTLRLKAGPDGYLYAMNEIANNIQVWDTEGNAIRQVTGFFGGPRDVAWDSVGNMYVTDTEAAKVRVYTGGGQFIQEWGEFGTGTCQLQLPTAIAIYQDMVFVIDVRPVKNPNTPNGISKIVKFTLDGDCIEEWRPAVGSSLADWEPTDMIIDENRIQVTDGFGFGDGNDQVTTISGGTAMEPSDVLGELKGVFAGSAQSTDENGTITEDPTCVRNPDYEPGYNGNVVTDVPAQASADVRLQVQRVYVAVKTRLRAYVTLWRGKAAVSQRPFGRYTHAGKDAYDFAVAEGTPVYPIVAGTVRFAGRCRDDYAPNKVVIDTHDGTHVYAHLSEIAVRTGDAVTTETLIGLSGTAGTGPHLHIELVGGAAGNNNRSLSQVMADAGFKVKQFPHF